MDRLPRSSARDEELARLEARDTFLETQVAQIQAALSLDTALSKGKRTLPQTATPLDAAPPRKKRANRSETQLQTSKASLLTCPVEAKEKGPNFDRRYNSERGPAPCTRAFSMSYLQYTRDDLDLRVTEFKLRHRNATECPVQQRCKHWHIVDGTEWHEEGDIYLLLYCLDIESATQGDTGCEGIRMFDDEEPLTNRITLQSCRIFNALKPDFSVVEDAGYVVLQFLVLDYGKTEEEDDSEWKWMDQFGRLLSKMGCKRQS
ncbi:uncharacterized protein BKA55DRAFT_695721 [Fusarium redolens]|uniref:Uncharacterized protein n=1 Tax=Fusarium redolens TaxID=48865 RepID=A0A9P9JPJ8_FUSRE|nr:uncharacterized protein BKA55DRAFT_695721 [Fusarium redolens]KAH7232303.1 hypothetical protein BKA55DRAFT_695721 [Fusarium redolens]